MPQSHTLENKHLFLKVVETGKSKIEVSTNLTANEESFPSLQRNAFLLCVHMTERSYTCISFYKGINLIMQD
jgi:hypothetical protein